MIAIMRLYYVISDVPVLKLRRLEKGRSLIIKDFVVPANRIIPTTYWYTKPHVRFKGLV